MKKKPSLSELSKTFRPAPKPIAEADPVNLPPARVGLDIWRDWTMKREARSDHTYWKGKGPLPGKPRM